MNDDLSKRLELAGFTKYPTQIDDMYIDIHGNMLIALPCNEEKSKQMLSILNAVKEDKNDEESNI